jgi:hypothetical protein
MCVSWKKQANVFHLEATLPERVGGELVVPRPGQGLLRLVHNGVERGVPPTGQQADGVESSPRTVTLQVAPGSHHVQLMIGDN